MGSAPGGFYPRTPDKPGELDGLTDNEVMEMARQSYDRLSSCPGWDNDHDDLLAAFVVFNKEMGRRGITASVTEGGSAVRAVASGWLITEGD
jgi:hypothetical protein